METALTIGIYFCLFMFGAAMFSFLNVVIYRTPINKSFVTGRSYCIKCHNTLKPYDMVPVFSWLILKGKCRFCKEPISVRHPVFETVGGLICVLCAWRYMMADPGEWMNIARFAIHFALLCILAVIFCIDADTQTIPDGTVIAVLVVGLLSLILPASFPWYDRIIGFFVVSLPMFIIVLIKPGGFGGGDIKLFAALGVFYGWKMTLLIFFLAVVAGGIYAAVGLARKTRKRSDHFAFGPYICVAALIVMFWGEALLSWYIKNVWYAGSQAAMLITYIK